MPDFAFPGPGVKVASVIAGSPAEQAGIQVGDVVVAVDGEELADLRAYGSALRSRAPGDVIAVRVRRGDETLDLEATLVAR
jgi:putative serine protease PepD